jgi:hypothetical protein
MDYIIVIYGIIAFVMRIFYWTTWASINKPTTIIQYSCNTHSDPKVSYYFYLCQNDVTSTYFISPASSIFCHISCWCELYPSPDPVLKHHLAFDLVILSWTCVLLWSWEHFSRIYGSVSILALYTLDRVNLCLGWGDRTGLFILGCLAAPLASTRRQVAVSHKTTPPKKLFRQFISLGNELSLVEKLCSDILCKVGFLHFSWISSLSFSSPSTPIFQSLPTSHGYFLLRWRVFQSVGT